MKALHPKLNWEEFQKLRKRRKQRKRLLLLFFLSFLGVGIGYFAMHFQKGIKPQSTDAKVIILDSLELTPIAKENADDIGNVKQGPQSSNPSQLSDSAVSTMGSQFIFGNTKNSKSNLLMPSGTFKKNEAIELATVRSIGTKKAPIPKFLSRNKQPNTWQQKLLLAVTNANAHRIQQISLDQRLLLAEGVTLSEIKISNPTHTENSAKSKNVQLPAMSLHVSYLPWHTDEFTAPNIQSGNDLNYQPTNSFIAGLEVIWFRSQKWHLAIAPQFTAQRFQTVYSTVSPNFQFAPNSLVGYLQTVKGFEPIFSDTVSGLEHVFIRKNGMLSEWVLPIKLRATLATKGAFHLEFNTAMGLQFVNRRSGIWVNNEQKSYPIMQMGPQWGFHLSGGPTLFFEQKYVRYGVFWQTTYRTALLSMQHPFRHQFGVTIEVPLIN